MTKKYRFVGTLDELNPIMGEYPSIGRVNSYFASALVLHYLAAEHLPEPWRTRF